MARFIEFTLALDDGPDIDYNMQSADIAFGVHAGDDPKVGIYTIAVDAKVATTRTGILYRTAATDAEWDAFVSSPTPYTLTSIIKNKDFTLELGAARVTFHSKDSTLYSTTLPAVGHRIDAAILCVHGDRMRIQRNRITGKASWRLPAIHDTTHAGVLNLLTSTLEYPQTAVVVSYPTWLRSAANRAIEVFAVRMPTDFSIEPDDESVPVASHVGSGPDGRTLTMIRELRYLGAFRELNITMDPERFPPLPTTQTPEVTTLRPTDRTEYDITIYYTHGPRCDRVNLVKDDTTDVWRLPRMNATRHDEILRVLATDDNTVAWFDKGRSVHGTPLRIYAARGEGPRSFQVRKTTRDFSTDELWQKAADHHPEISAGTVDVLGNINALDVLSTIGAPDPPAQPRTHLYTTVKTARNRKRNAAALLAKRLDAILALLAITY